MVAFHRLEVYYWCNECSRVFTSESGKTHPKCPHDSCGSSDTWKWRLVQRINNSLPIMPTAGERYDIRSKNSKYRRLEKDMEYTLVVDDDRYMLSMVKQVLECERIKAHCVASGEEALQKLEEMSFLLMITDLNMPGGMDGFELAKKTREIAPHMPIIMSTGDISPKIHCMAKEIGITEVLAKPFPPDKFVEIVKGVLEIERKKAS